MMKIPFPIAKNFPTTRMKTETIAHLRVLPRATPFVPKLNSSEMQEARAKRRHEKVEVIVYVAQINALHPTPIVGVV
jgi:hypothetical protein